MRYTPLALLVFALFIFTSSEAQTSKGFSLAPTDTASTSGKTYALIVGISKYRNHVIPHLEFADKDALAFRDYLIASGVDSNNITLLLNEKALSSEIKSDLYYLCTDSVKKGDKLYFYFSGHGDVESAIRADMGYLLPYDATDKVYSISSFDIHTLQDYVSKAASKEAQVILVTDACHAGTLAGGKQGSTNFTNALKTEWSEVVKILSCQAGELSQEGMQWGNGRGLFSYELINGLAGDADRNKTGYVTLNDLSIYLSDKVPQEAKPIPQFPLVTGNMRTILAQTNPAYLAKLKGAEKRNKFETMSLKGSEKELLNGLPDSIKKNYDLFRNYLDRGILTGRSSVSSAWFYYSRIPENESTKLLCGLMKRNFSSALMNDLNADLNSFVENRKIIHSNEEFQKLLNEAIILRNMLGDIKLDDLDFLTHVLFTEAVEGIMIGADKQAMEKALLKLDTCTSLDSNAAYIYQMRGQINVVMKNYKQGLEDAKKAILLSPKFMTPYLVLARAYSGMNLHDSALSIYNRIIEMDSSYSYFTDNLIALEYFEMGKLFKARKYHRKAEHFIKTVSDTAQKIDDFYAIGYGGYHLGYFSNAIPYFKKILDLKRYDHTILFDISRCYALLNKKSKALKYLEKSLQAGEDDYDNIQETGDFKNIRNTPEYYALMKKYFPDQAK